MKQMSKKEMVFKNQASRNATEEWGQDVSTFEAPLKHLEDPVQVHHVNAEKDALSVAKDSH